MKKGRFLWSAHRITERQKDGKARSIKGKQLKNSRSTVSKPLVAHCIQQALSALLYQGFCALWLLWQSRGVLYAVMCWEGDGTRSGDFF